MNGTAALIGVARFQRDREIADTAEEALSRRGVSDACHNCGPPCGLRIINRQAREHLSHVQSCDQSILATQTQVLQQDTRLWEALCGNDAPEEIHSSGTFVPSHRQDGRRSEVVAQLATPIQREQTPVRGVDLKATIVGDIVDPAHLHR
jgi:hypothetical protein